MGVPGEGHDLTNLPESSGVPVEPAASFSIANINPGVVRSEFMLSVLSVVNQERTFQHTHDPLNPRIRFDRFYSQLSGPYLDDERNRCVQWFLNHCDSDWLLFIDSDIEFNPLDAYRLIGIASETELTLVTGIYYSSIPGRGMCGLVYEWGHDEQLDQQNLLPLSSTRIQDKGDTFRHFPIDAAGAGFLAIHRDCLLDMQKLYTPPTQWFAEIVLDGIHLGEDLTFCLRAEQAGHKLHMIPSITVTHYKTCAIRP